MAQQARPTTSTVGGCINGFQGGYTYFNVALRILANKGPKYNVLSMPAVTLDNTNLKAYAKPGLPLTSNEELPGPKTAWCDDTCLNKYFVKPGSGDEVARRRPADRDRPGPRPVVRRAAAGAGRARMTRP